MGAPVHMVGRRFGRLVVIQQGDDHESNGAKTRRWVCKCDCGSQVLTYGNGLRSGHAKSCGCLQREVTSRNSLRHGMSTSGAYKSWIAMKVRCTDTSAVNYQNYGGRGIGFCDRWKSFENFLSDMGDRPVGKSLDRIDVSKNYDPLNCKWSTKTEQDNNKRTSVFVTLGDKTLTLSQWSRELGVHVKTLSRRYQKTGSFEPITRIYGTPKGEIMSKKFPEPQAFEEGPAPLIEMHPIASTQIRSIGYDAETKTLAVTFNFGKALYQYPDVAPATYEAFRTSDSAGKFFGTHIKDLPFKKFHAETATA